MARGRIDHLVNLRHGEAILRIGLVEVGEVYAASPSPIWFWDYNRVRNLDRVLRFLNEPGPD